MTDLSSPGPDERPYTMQIRMCDDDGMVSDEPAPPYPLNLTWLQMFNNMRRYLDLRSEEVTEPFHCTGSAHLGGQHILCTSPAHERIAAKAHRHTLWSDNA